MNWSAFDFIVAAILLSGTASMVYVGIRRSELLTYRLGMLLAIGLGLVLAWANLAVGLIGDETNPINLSYFVLLSVGIASAVWTRLKAPKMQWVLAGMAFGQLMIGVSAIILGRTEEVQMTILASVVFALLWLTSAGLFHVASRSPNHEPSNLSV